MDMTAFFRLHDGLPREGPGSAADVLWATSRAATLADASILDAGCGPGGDVAALLQAAPDGHVLALDSHPGFVADLNNRFANDPRVTARCGDMMEAEGPFDLIWCAGAIYFVGVTQALQGWRSALSKGGAIAFSQACLFKPDPPAEVDALFEGLPVGDADQIRAEIDAAGFELIDSRPVSDDGWEAYYQPQEARIAKLRPTADLALTKVLDAAEVEMSVWRAHRDHFGYLLCVVKPKQTVPNCV